MAEEFTGPYMDWVLPWGETCRKAEKRLYDLGIRGEFMKRAEELKHSGAVDTYDKAMYYALIEYHPDDFPTPGPEIKPDPGFVEMCQKALRSKNIPSRAPIDDDISWVGENIYCDRPRVYDAPSKMALALAIAAHKDPKIEARLWDIYLSKRMSPGDRTPKAKVFAEDRTGAAEQEAEGHQEELMRRLFGGVEK